MADRKLKDSNLRKLFKLGEGSLALTLPRELVNELGWKEKQKVVVRRQGRHLVVKDWKKKLIKSNSITS